MGENFFCWKFVYESWLERADFILYCCFFFMCVCLACTRFKILWVIFSLRIISTKNFFFILSSKFIFYLRKKLNNESKVTRPNTQVRGRKSQSPNFTSKEIHKKDSFFAGTFFLKGLKLYFQHYSKSFCSHLSLLSLSILV